MKEVSHKRPHIVWLYSYEMLRTKGLENLSVGKGWKWEEELTTKRHHKEIWGDSDGTVPYDDFDAEYDSMYLTKCLELIITKQILLCVS